MGSGKNYFEKIIRYLRRKRQPSVNDPVYLDDTTIEFQVRTEYYEKNFRIHYQDSELPFLESYHSTWDSESRPRGFHYRIWFVQENVPQGNRLVNIEDDRWFKNAEDVVHEIKRLCRNWRC